MSKVALEKAINEREAVKAHILFLESELHRHSNEPLTHAEVDLLLEDSKIYQLKVIENTKLILAHKPDDPTVHTTVHEELYRKIYRLVASFTGIKMSFTPSTTPIPTVSHNGSNQATSVHEIRLPKLEIPSFDGKVSDWVSFRDLFQNTIHSKTTISNSEKFAYLKSLVKGEAARLISTLVVTDANYEIAWSKLVGRYQNEREIVFAVLDKMVSHSAVTPDHPGSIRELIDVTLECQKSLEIFNVELDKGLDTMLMYHTFRKLDAISKQLWEQTLKDTKVPSFNSLVEFLEARARSLTASLPVASKPQAAKRAQAHHSSGWKCRVCSSHDYHTIYKCGKFNKLPVNERFKLTMKLNLCSNCLREGHKAASCSSSTTCFRCHEKHHTLLHREKPGEDETEPAAKRTALHQSNSNSQTIFATAKVLVSGGAFGVRKSARVFFDNGSSDCYITERCAKHAGLTLRKTHSIISGLGSSAVGVAKHATTFSVQPHFKSQYSLSIDAFVIPRISSNMPSTSFNPTLFPHFRNLRLADPEFYKSSEVDILIGGDVFFSLLKDGKKSAGATMPTAINSNFGWLISGRSSFPSTSHNFHVVEDLSDRLQSFWKIEDIPNVSTKTLEEQSCEKVFETTTSRDAEGRYVVAIPWKSSKQLGNSRTRAEQRLLSLEKRLDVLRSSNAKLKNDELECNMNFKEEYVSFMKEYYRLGHMEKVPQSELNNQSVERYYIPHQFILKNDSTTTKFRVVFDASCKTSNGLSLNSAMMTGPTIQDTLINILTRFRRHQIALTADIKQMYRQIWLRKEDTDMHRILWREEKGKPIEEYRLLTVTYGTAAAPYLATRVLEQIATDYQLQYPLASEVLLNDFYVDDFMGGANTKNDACKLMSQLINVLKHAGMELRKWSSNNESVLDSISPELRECKQLLPLSTSETVKTLGIYWEPEKDEFHFYFRVPTGERATSTKRRILSEIAGIFDPMGWFSPLVIRAKTFMQTLWRSSAGWDDELPNDYVLQWHNYKVALNQMKIFKIPRCILPVSYDEILLIGFCDASEKAFAAAVYLATYQSKQQNKVSLIISKTRVAPVKNISIPRLELCGALLLAELCHSVKQSIQLSINDVFLYTDSTVALTWIRSCPSRWKTFVSNRVSKIQEITSGWFWGHVSTHDNPADAASRGISPDELCRHNLWWDGPSFLQHRPASKDNDTSFDLTTLTEEKPRAINIHTACSEEFLIGKYSKLAKLMRVTAYVMRFVRKIRASKNVSVGVGRQDSLDQEEEVTGVGSLASRGCGLGTNRSRSTTYRMQISCPTTLELNNALMTLVKISQSIFFAHEINSLQKDTEVTKLSPIRSLCPFLDTDGIVRVGGRLSNAAISKDRKFPILLPRHGMISKLIIRDAHQRNYHSGCQATMAYINRRFWIIRGRDAIRQEIRKCTRCIRHAAECHTEMMGNLPSSRVNPANPFQKCGVDYAGPFELKPNMPRSKSTVKGYLALFVCFVTRAIHIEVVSSLSTAAFLAALKRFVSRRGRPCEIWSDCGTNFQGASTELKKWLVHTQTNAFNNGVSSELAGEGIVWKFIPPGAPHFGGLWEAGIKSTKFHLRRILGLHKITFEEMSTIVTQVEAILNSRPLTQMSSDPNDLQALTPGHFLVGRPLTAIPEEDMSTTRIGYNDRWKLLQQFQQHFWKRWSTEFLTRLQQRPKWTTKGQQLQLNQLVIIKNELQPPQKWLLARIVELHHGKDEKVRVVTLRTASGILKRPISKICPLPICNE